MIDLDEQIAEAQRELRMRYGVYKKRVASGAMTQEEHDRLIRLQVEIIKSLERLKRIDEAKGELV